MRGYYFSLIRKIFFIVNNLGYVLGKEEDTSLLIAKKRIVKRVVMSYI